MRRSHLAPIVLVPLILGACRDRPPAAAAPATPVPARAAGRDTARSRVTVAAAIEQIVWNQSAPAFLPVGRWALVRHVYDAGHYAPRWLSPEGLTPAARTLVDAICADFYEAIRVHALAADTNPTWLAGGAGLAAADAAALARIDLRLTGSMVDYLSDLSAGQVDPRTVSSQWLGPAPSAAPDSALVPALALSLDQAAALFRPASGAYAPLRSALERYRAMEDRGGWTPPRRSPLLRRGSRDSMVAWLRSRLIQSGDLAAADSAGSGYSGSVVAAVRRAQQRYGLRPDGVVGAATWQALAAPAGLRAATVAANLERLRWFPRVPAGAAVVLDLGGGTLDVRSAGELLLSAAVRPDDRCRDELPPAMADTIRAATPDSNALVLVLGGGRVVHLRRSARGRAPGCMAPEDLRRVGRLLAGIMASGEPVLFYLVAPTALPLPEGGVRFRIDTTGEDARLRAALEQTAPVGGCVPDAAAAPALSWRSPPSAVRPARRVPHRLRPAPAAAGPDPRAG